MSVQDLAQLSQHGTRHGTLNQDAAFTCTLPDATVAAVFDGHGILGERAASAAVAELQSATGAPGFAAGFAADPEHAMEVLFEQLQRRVLAAHEDPPATYSYPGKPNSEPLEFRLADTGGALGQPPCARPRRAAAGPDRRPAGTVFECTNGPMSLAPIDFGATAAVAVVVGGRLVVGSIGDAGAVVCYVTDEGEAEGELISAHHTASDAEEMERIERDFPGKALFTPDGYLAPLDDVLGQFEVQLTRSLGHAQLGQFGITCTPEVRVVELQPADGRTVAALVLCSDGVTDELQPRDIAQRTMDAPTAAEAAAVLVQEAQDYCMDRDRVDDCTVALLAIGAAPEAEYLECDPAAAGGLHDAFAAHVAAFGARDLAAAAGMHGPGSIRVLETQAPRLARTLREAEQFYRDMFARIGDHEVHTAVLDVDADGGVVFWVWSCPGAQLRSVANTFVFDRETGAVAHHTAVVA